MLTPEQIQEARKRLNVTATVPKPQDISTPTGAAIPSLSNRLQTSWSAAPQAEPVKKTQVDIAKEAGSGVAESFNGAQVKAGDAVERQLAGKQGIGQTIWQVLGVGAGLGNEIIGHGIKALIDLNVPQETQDAIGKSVGETIKSSPLLQSGLEAAKGGMEKYQEWAKTNQKDAANLESLINIPLFVTQFVGAGAGAKGTISAAEKVIPKVEEAALAASGKVKSVAQKVLPKAVSAEEKALAAITPATKDLTPTQYSELLKAGKITPKTPTSPAKYILPEKERALATKYAPLLQEGDSVKHINNAVTDIINKDVEVGKFLAKDQKVYQKEALRKYIVKYVSEIDDITIPKARLSEARKDLVNSFMARVPEGNSGRTFDKLWQSRKANDLTSKAFSGSPTLKKDMEKAVRKGVQNFIADNTKDGVYATKMKDMTELYDLIDLLEVSAKKEKGLSALATWAKNNPGKVAITEGVIGTGLLTGLILK